MAGKSIKERLEQRLAENTSAHNRKQEELPDFLTTREKTVSQVVTLAKESASPRLVSVELVDPNPWQPRTYFPDEEIHDLAASIAEIGLIQPVIVRSVTSGRFELVAGERRFRAHKVLGKKEISAVVIEATNDEMAVMALAENLDREDLSDYEIGKAIRRAEVEFPSRKKMAEAIGIARQDFYRYLAFDTLPNFAKIDLDANPRLLGRAAAENVKQTLSKHNSQEATNAFEKAWGKLKEGSLDQGSLVAAIESGIKDLSETQASREISKIYAGGKHAGSITKDWRTFTIKIKNGYLDESAEHRLMEFIQELLPKD